MDAYEKAEEQFKREEQAYWTMRDNLMKDYYGLWVAIVNGQVVASGKKAGQVGYEAYLKTGSEVCYCAQVGFEDRVLQIRQVTAGYFDVGYVPPLPKARLLTRAFHKNISESLDFLVDTGADLTLLQTESVNRLGLRRVRGMTARVRGIGGIPEQRQLY